MPQWTGLEAARFTAARDVGGSDNADLLDGTSEADRILAGGGDDQVNGNGGDDRVEGGAGFDAIYGNKGDDALFGGTGGDFLFGGSGNDTLFGDGGFETAKGSDLAADRLSGGSGDDRLIQSDGNDVMSGGGGADRFEFRWNDPSVALAAGTGRAFTEITDFKASSDTLTFDAAGVGKDRLGANFVDGGSADDAPGGAAASFFSGDAADSDGQAVMVLTEQAFASGVDAVLAAQGEAAGDLILYFNSAVGVASLLYVDGEDAAHSIARFTNITSVDELAGAGFTAEDFVFV